MQGEEWEVCRRALPCGGEVCLTIRLPFPSRSFPWMAFLPGRFGGSAAARAAAKTGK